MSEFAPLSTQDILTGLAYKVAAERLLTASEGAAGLGQAATRESKAKVLRTNAAQLTSRYLAMSGGEDFLSALNKSAEANRVDSATAKFLQDVYHNGDTAIPTESIHGGNVDPADEPKIALGRRIHEAAGRYAAAITIGDKNHPDLAIQP